MADNYTSKITDTSLFGGISNGSIKYLSSSDALRNSIMMWLCSFKGDYIGQPTRGGILTSIINKPMKSSMIPQIEASIRSGLSYDYTGIELQILSLNVEANYEKRHWIISVEVYSPSLKMQTTVEEEVQGV